MNNPTKGLAVFDFDGTIIKKDSFIEFIRFTHGSVKLYLCYFYNSFYIILYFLRMYPNYKIKELFFSYFYKGYEETELNELGKEFSQKKIYSYYHKHAEEILSWHKTQNHDILILTASSSIWMGEWCSQNEYTLIGTKFESVNGKFTGKIEGKNCYGQEKERRIEALINNYDFHQTYGYGDTESDKFFLNRLNHIYFGSLKNRIQI